MGSKQGFPWWKDVTGLSYSFASIFLVSLTGAYHSSTCAFLPLCHATAYNFLYMSLQITGQLYATGTKPKFM